MSWKDDRGFTLVELILTIAILAIVTIPILNYFTDAAKHNARSRQKQNAAIVAQEVLESFKNSAYSLDDPQVVCTADPNWTVASGPDADGVYTLTENKTADKNSFKITAKIKPISKVDRAVPAASPAAAMDYKKYLIGTMDSSKDVMVSEHGQTRKAASLAFANKNSAACAVSGNTQVSAAEIEKNLSCTILVSAKQDPKKKPENDIITATYEYRYEKGAGAYPDGIDDTTVYSDVVESASIKVDKLENIYLFYSPLTTESHVTTDTIKFVTNDDNAIQSNAENINLFIIAQSSVPNGTVSTEIPAGYTERPSSYLLKLDAAGSGFNNKIAKVYLNLSLGKAELAGNGLEAKAQKDSSGKEYTLVHSEDINRVADITVTVDSQDGTKTGIVEVSGSKVQN